MINYKEKYLKYKKKYLKIKKMFGGNGMPPKKKSTIHEYISQELFNPIIPSNRINSYSIDKDPFFEDTRKRIEDIKDEQKLTQMQNNVVFANKEVEEQIKLENERMRLEELENERMRLEELENEKMRLENPSYENNNSVLIGSGILIATITSVFLLLKS